MQIILRISTIVPLYLLCFLTDTPQLWAKGKSKVSTLANFVVAFMCVQPDNTSFPKWLEGNITHIVPNLGNMIHQFGIYVPVGEKTKQNIYIKKKNLFFIPD